MCMNVYAIFIKSHEISKVEEKKFIVATQILTKSKQQTTDSTIILRILVQWILRIEKTGITTEFQKRNGILSPSMYVIELLLFAYETKWKRLDQFYLCVQYTHEFIHIFEKTMYYTYSNAVVHGLYSNWIKFISMLSGSVFYFIFNFGFVFFCNGFSLDFIFWIINESVEKETFCCCLASMLARNFFWTLSLELIRHNFIVIIPKKFSLAVHWWHTKN